jgi:hypothetical protein
MLFLIRLFLLPDRPLFASAIRRPSVLSSDQQQARKMLNQGVQAFKNAPFAEAVPLSVGP